MRADGYFYENTVIEQWEYVGRGVEKYTEYTFRYNWMGQNADNIKGVGYGKDLTICNEPYPGQTVAEPVAVEVQEEEPPKKRAKWPVVLGTIVDKSGLCRFRQSPLFFRLSAFFHRSRKIEQKNYFFRADPRGRFESGRMPPFTSKRRRRNFKVKSGTPAVQGQA